MASVFALPPPPSSAAATPQPLVGGSWPLPDVVAAGRSFHRRRVPPAALPSAAAASAASDSEEAEILARYRASIAGRNFLDLNYYQQLGLSMEDPDISPDVVRGAYRRVLMEHHPDKTGRAENDPNYLSLQRAFATLMDTKLRRAYDSQCDVDDSIPTGKETIRQHQEDDDNDNDRSGRCFYALYGPVFARNARFSVVQPVPGLGTDDTPLEDVYRFYDFWQTFDSWRDFSHQAEALDSAGHRDEKRHQAKQAEAAAKKQKKKEYQRLVQLCDRARAADPRLRREKRAQEDAKREAADARAAERAAAEAAAQAEADAAAAAESAAAAEAKATAQAAKFAKEQQKKVVRKAKKALREWIAASDSIAALLDVEEVAFLCDELTLEQLQAATGNETAILDLWTSLRGQAYVDQKRSKL